MGIKGPHGRVVRGEGFGDRTYEHPRYDRGPPPRRESVWRGRLEALGAIPQRAPVGHRPRGLQRSTALPGTTSRTIRPAAAPTAGARTASPASLTMRQQLCFALALWNGRDPILKERLFGLTGNEGNHGEDVKEYYFYLDATPTGSYLKMLYKYPQAAYPVPRPRRDQPSAQQG